ncbi:head completion/stabilization protein [Pseudomonas sp. SWRI196]|uniref:Head completion/stabilization protein n=1 Tax=Pseudomonas tehranensis TaxID=2745502 RepID=A0ABR6UPM5_9PSED|nr:head completion/stabilization protein [Pseudomonas tehranensis]MBC3346563.1 head completion/stabilization protein [Pseudomonas tehranensis]
MSGFIATGSIDEPFVITNDGFWPDIDVVHLRDSIRLDGSITDARIEVVTVNALIQVNGELASVKLKHTANGYDTLAAVPASNIKGESHFVHLYRRSIYCSVGAELAERYRSYDSSVEGNKNADELTPSVDEYRRDARFAIRDLLGVGHSTVELI